MPQISVLHPWRFDDPCKEFMATSIHTGCFGFLSFLMFVW